MDRGSSRVVPGQIVGAVYTGPIVRYLVEVGGTRPAVDLHDPRHGPRYADGERVSVQLPADLRVLPAGRQDLWPRHPRQLLAGATCVTIAPGERPSA